MESIRRISPLVLLLAGTAAVSTAHAQVAQQLAYLKSPSPFADQGFGHAIAVSGDTVVVGGDDNSVQPNSGAAFVFVRSGMTWTQQAVLKASNAQTDDSFAWSVAISGDTMVVGAPGEDSSASGVNGNQLSNDAEGAGAAYVFVRSGTTWTQQAYLKASNPEGCLPGPFGTCSSPDAFGDSVAIAGDTIVVGAHGEDSGASGVNGNQADNSYQDAGAAYVFHRTGTTWTQQAYLKPRPPARSGQLWGYSVDVSGDTVVVGRSNGESASVFVRQGTTWTDQAELYASNAEPRDWFGRTVSVHGDRIAVGAPWEDSGATGVNGNGGDNSVREAGAAYVFARSGTTWTQEAYLKASNPDMDDWFGYSVSIADGVVIVGALLEDSQATGINGSQSNYASSGEFGAAYAFVHDGAEWHQRAYLKASNAGYGDRFGFPVVVDGSTVVISAAAEDGGSGGVNGNQADNSRRGAGAVYVFEVRPEVYGCATPAAGHGAPTLAVTAGRPAIFSWFDLTIQNASPTATAASLGFELFTAPTPSPQFSASVLGICWNLPVPFNGAFVPVPTSTTIRVTVPPAPSLIGAEIDWQVLALDPVSTSSGVLVTTSRGLTTRFP